MRAIQIVRLEGPDSVELCEVSDPVPGVDQVLINVDSAGVTFPDVLLTRGEYQLRPQLPFIPGCEVSGTVLEAPVGSAVSAGDRVAAFNMLGGFAERVSVPQDLVFRLPESMSFATGAALPMNYLTVHFALMRRGRLKAGETVLVHGAAGGIGTAAIQLAKAAGARVIAVVSTAAKRKVAEQAGADETVLADGFQAVSKEITRGRGVDVVVDPVGGDRFTDSLRSLAPEGRMLVIGFSGGEIPTVKVNRLLLNNLDVVGVGWGAFAFGKPGFIAAQWDELAAMAESGALQPPIGGEYRLADAGLALAELAERRAIGKVIIRVREETAL